MKNTDRGEFIKSQLFELDTIERAAKSERPCCAGCTFYWDDSDSVRPWGHCRRHPPALETMYGEHAGHSDAYLAVPVVPFNWYCGEFKRGCHPDILERRKQLRGDLQSSGR